MYAIRSYYENLLPQKTDQQLEAVPPNSAIRPYLGQNPKARRITSYNVCYTKLLRSMGLFVPGDKPLIWRGPMAHKALERLHLGDVGVHVDRCRLVH